MTAINKAATLADVERFTRPQPLTEATWQYYINTDQARGNGAIRNLIIKLQNAFRDDRRIHAIVSGHGGCGKSTELIRVSQQVSDQYDIRISRVLSRYSAIKLDYLLFLFHCAELVVEHAEMVQAALRPEEVRSLLGWFDQETIDEVRSSGYQIEAGAGGQIKVDAGYGIPVLLKIAGELFAKFYSKIFYGHETREDRRRHIEHRLDELMQHIDVIVRAIESKIAPRKLLLIFEDLDKLDDHDAARRLFIEHRLQLQAIPVCTIFTFPIYFWYDPQDVVSLYEDRLLLPMISVQPAPPSGEYIEEELAEKAALGQKTLEDIAYRRLDKSLIDPVALQQIIKKSGGVLRDMLLMLRDAALEGQALGGNRIEMDHAKAAIRNLRGEYTRKLGSNTKISQEQLDQALGEARNWPRRDPERSAAFRVLLQSLCILEYNGEVWYDLHPFVRDYLQIRDDERRRRG